MTPTMQPAPRSRTAGSVPGVLRSALLIVSVLLLAAGTAFTAERVWAVFEEVAETGEPGLLSLGVDDRTPVWVTLAPGDTRYWLVEASLDDAERGALSLELRASGALLDPAGLTAAVSACSGEFSFPDGAEPSSSAPVRCSGAARTVLETTPLADLASGADRYDLAALRRGEPRQLLVALSIPADTPDSAVHGRSARVGLGVHATGGRADHRAPPGPLERTGADLLAIGLLAAGLIGLGIALGIARPRREDGVRT